MSNRGQPGQVFNIPAGVAFADALARGLLARTAGDPLALARMTLLLPTRRAARAVSEAFLRVAEGDALLLPRMFALADLDEEAGITASAALPPAIARLDRLLQLARLVASAGDRFAATPEQALKLAQSLADLIDEVQTEGVDFAKLSELAPEEFAHHWQDTLQFLRIVTEVWPAILTGGGLVDPVRRRISALEARRETWTRNPPADPVIAAGFVNADPALSDLIAAIARLPQGIIVLPGLDLDLDNEGWEAIEATHPQFGPKALIARIGIDRDQIRPWPGVNPADAESRTSRARLLAESLRPAETTERWRTMARPPGNALDGLTLLECETAGEEAEAIALAMRQTLEIPGRTAALVTPDRGLARRVAAALRRWGVEVDDSAGRPLAETPVGVFLELVIQAAVADFAPRPLLALLKHPLAACGLEPEALRRLARSLERAALRGPRPAPGLEGLASALRRIEPRAFDGGPAEKDELLGWIADLARRVEPLTEIVAAKGGRLADLVLAHGEAAEALAETTREAGPFRLWRGQDGEAAADLLARLAGPASASFPELAAEAYPAALGLLMRSVAIRPLYGAHPRLSIWGLIEARLQQADLTILSGLNEGVWPPLPGDEPWMSRPMRTKFGLPPLEARIGLAAQDFLLAASGPDVLLTRAKRAEGAPTVRARFLSRLETMLGAFGLSIPRADAAAFAAWAEAIDRPQAIQPCRPPLPRPPLRARPRKLSVTAVETWMRNPYALYARHILKLNPLDPIDADPGAAERGNFIHEALHRFISEAGADLDERDLLAAGRAVFGDAIAHPSVGAFWWPRFERIARWFLTAFERPRRLAGIMPLATEVAGSLELAGPGGPFTLTAKADRIDRLSDGRLAILDYKTGRVPKADEVSWGLAPQLPLEAAIAEFGGFAGVPRSEIAELTFLKLTGGNPPGEIFSVLDGIDMHDEVLAARDGLLRLIALFDNPATPYPAKPRPEFARGSDYDHLARIGE
jgi:ATP-dependent helicase/nuclease subunit B